MDDQKTRIPGKYPQRTSLASGKVGGTTGQGKVGGTPSQARPRAAQRGGRAQYAKCIRDYLFFLRLLVFLMGMVRWPPPLLAKAHQAAK